MATRTARRQSTKSKNNRKDPKNIWFKHKMKVGRNPKRLPTDIKRMAKSSNVSVVFDELYKIHNLPIPPGTGEGSIGAKW